MKKLLWKNITRKYFGTLFLKILAERLYFSAEAN